MKAENLLRAASTLLLLSLNVIATMLFGIIGDLRTDVGELNEKMQNVQLRLFGAEKDISVLQEKSTSFRGINSQR